MLSTPRSTRWSLPFSFSDLYLVCIYHLPYACYMSRPSRRTCLLQSYQSRARRLRPIWWALVLRHLPKPVLQVQRRNYSDPYLIGDRPWVSLKENAALLAAQMVELRCSVQQLTDRCALKLWLQDSTRTFNLFLVFSRNNRQGSSSHFV
jgi:hypothetical protein